MSVRVRLAPSPTGPLHVGTARTALFNALFAKGHDGAFILRIEDTDRARSNRRFEEEILSGLRWLRITWDEGPDIGGPHAPYRQSERLTRYADALEQLLRDGEAVEREGAVFFRVAEDSPLVVHDLIRGDVRFPPSELKDFVIATSAGHPLFHLAVVVDDAEMRITHVIRGEDHLSNTPRHLLLQRALGLPTPAYAHLPLLLDTRRQKLSKRAAVTRLLAYRDAGYLSEAVLNFLALLGWNPKTKEEVFTFADLVERFSIAAVQKGGAIYQEQKLDWLQRAHLRRLSPAERVARARPFLPAVFSALPDVMLARALTVWSERGGRFAEAASDLAYLAGQPALDPADLPWRGTTAAEAKDALAGVASALAEMAPEGWGSAASLQEVLLRHVSERKLDRGTVLWPLRYALSGRRESPGPAELAWVLGREETLRRLARGAGDPPG